MNAAEVLVGVVSLFPQSCVFSEVTLRDEEWYSRYSEGQSALRTRRIDALAISESGERVAVEVKVSLSDFRRDDWSKRAPWMSVTHRFYYAVPAGLRDYAPSGCGLIWVHQDGTAEVVEEADLRMSANDLPHHVQMELYRRAPLSTAVPTMMRA